MVPCGHSLVLSLGLGDGNARTRGLKRGCPKKDGKNSNKNGARHFVVQPQRELKSEVLIPYRYDYC